MVMVRVLFCHFAEDTEAPAPAPVPRRPQRLALAAGPVLPDTRPPDEQWTRQSIARSHPVGLGLLACPTLKQANQPSGGNAGNKGHEAADAFLEMLRLQRNMRRPSLPGRQRPPPSLLQGDVF